MMILAGNYKNTPTVAITGTSSLLIKIIERREQKNDAETLNIC